MYNVCILMSTYNGEIYLKEQLDSILRQKNVDIRILIRDDGSTDKTCQIISDYITKHENIKLKRGHNIGVTLSFLDLIKNAPEADYYAFSDQDDFWLEEKILNAIKMIENCDSSNIPILYHSNVTIADEKLSPIRKSRKKENFSKYTCLVDNNVTGCTVVINSLLLNLLRMNIPQFVTMHDVWMNIVASFFGKIVFDCNSYILYRQHANNVIGMQDRSIFSRVSASIKRLRNKSIQPRLGNAKSLLEVFRDKLPLKDLNELMKIINYQRSLFDRMRLLFDVKIHSYSLLKDLKYRILIIMGRI